MNSSSILKIHNNKNLQTLLAQKSPLLKEKKKKKNKTKMILLKLNLLLRMIV